MAEQGTSDPMLASHPFSPMGTIRSQEDQMMLALNETEKGFY